MITEPVTLVDGRWEGEPVVEDGVSRPAVYLARNFRLTGDLDADGSDEAVVLLGESSGGTGEYIHLAIVEGVDGRLSNTATVLVGDRVQIRDAMIEDRRIVLEVLQAGPDDAMCCPGELARRIWEMEGEGLREVPPPTRHGRLSLSTIAGTEWVLRSWAWDEPAPLEPEVTLVFEDRRLAGNAGCNRYFAAAEAGASPGDVSVGPAGSTRRACPDPIMGVEDRFFRQLGGVRKFGFVTTQLALTYESDGAMGTMLFDRRSPETTR